MAFDAKDLAQRIHSGGSNRRPPPRPSFSAGGGSPSMVDGNDVVHHYRGDSVVGGGNNSTAVVLQPGVRFNEGDVVTIGGQPARFHGHDEGRQVWAVYGQPNLEPVVAVNGRTVFGNSAGGTSTAQRPSIIPKLSGGSSGSGGAGVLAGTAIATEALRNPAVRTAISNGLKGLFGGSAPAGAGASGGVGAAGATIPTSTAATSAAPAASQLGMFAPWAAGGLAALGIYAGRKNPVERWNNIADRYTRLGASGGLRPTSDYNFFGIDSTQQEAYDAGKRGDKLDLGTYSNVARYNDNKRKVVQEEVAKQGYGLKDIRSRNAGPTYTKKEKAAARIADRTFGASIPAKYNPFILTDADRGGN